MRPAALTATVLVLLLAGCGEDEDARRAVVAAAEKTTNEGPMRLEQEARILVGEDQYSEITVAGVVDGRKRTAFFSIEHDTTGGDPSTPFARRLDRQDGDFVVAGPRTYARMPALGYGDRWVSYPNDSALAARRGFPAGSSAGTLDQTRPVDQARSADDVKREGEEEIDGRPTTRYRLTLDFERYLDIADPELAASLRKPFERLERMFRTSRFPATAWIDEDGYIARFESRLETPTGTDIGSYTIDLEPTDEKPVVPRGAVPLRKLAGR
jgi:hypothetical protein